MNPHRKDCATRRSRTGCCRHSTLATTRTPTPPAARRSLTQSIWRCSG